jgi:hypothetical protein
MYRRFLIVGILVLIVFGMSNSLVVANSGCEINPEYCFAFDDGGGSAGPDGSSFDEAIEAPLISTIEGTITTSKQEIYYEFTLSMPKVVIIESSNAGNASLDLKGTLYNSSEVEIIYSYDKVESLTNVNLNFYIVQVLTPGSYYLHIERESGYGNFEFNIATTSYEESFGSRYTADDFIYSMTSADANGVVYYRSNLPSEYTDELNAAIAEWESVTDAYGNQLVQFIDVENQSNIMHDLYITMGFTFCSTPDAIGEWYQNADMGAGTFDVICLNSDWFNLFDDYQIYRIILHELGHSLGMKHNGVFGRSVVMQALTHHGLSGLSYWDKKALISRWG